MKNRILLLEDDIALSMGITHMLEEEGYSVSTSSTLKEAFTLFEKTTFDLLLLDIMLPDGTGYEFCKSVRKTSDTPVIFLSALDEEVNVVMGLDIGADDYITKPFRGRELAARINSILRRRQSSSSISNILRLDESNMSFIFNDTKIDLTIREYKLLYLLMNNKNTIMTRQVLLENIWDSDSAFVDDNTLSVYIKRLREKLSDFDLEEHIETIKGAGYRWNE